MQNNNFLVAGAANIDVISKISQKGSNNNHRGTIDFALGGCGLNMALNLKHLNNNVEFITALNENSFINQTIINQLNNKNIKAIIKQDKSLADSAFSCIIDKTGETQTSILQEVLYKTDIEEKYFEENISNIEALLITAELSEISISNAIKIANKYNKKIFIAGCSAEEVTRIDFNTGKIDYLFLNKYEATTFAKIKQCQSLEELATLLNTTIIVTLGKDGAAAYSKKTSKLFKSDKKEISGNTLGAGDYFMASFANQIIKNNNLEVAINKTFESIDKILSKKQANMN